MNQNPTKISDIKANGPWVIVKIDEVPEKTASGLIIHEADVKVDPSVCGTGVIVSIGSGEIRTTKKEKLRFVVDAEPGDRVLYKRWVQGAKRLDNWVEDGKKCCFIHKQDIIAKIPKDAVVGLHSTAMKVRE